MHLFTQFDYSAMPPLVQEYGGKLFFSYIFLLQKERCFLLSCVKTELFCKKRHFFFSRNAFLTEHVQKQKGSAVWKICQT
jgi:hypothetical protein